MKNQKLKTFIWRALTGLSKLLFNRRFNFSCLPCQVEGPCLIVANHATSYDPLLVAQSFNKQPVSFVASEHIFRWGLISKLICALVDPIPRSKGSSGANTVMMCLRKLKAGGHVGLFAEGEMCWDGLGLPIVPSTGKLARMSGATLVTYRLEGAYLTRPRWSANFRRGRMYGSVVGIYSPEELRHMSPEEITALINRDIYEDSWQSQKDHPIEYKGKGLAEGIERAIYLCPCCNSFGTIRGQGDMVRCSSCGLELRINSLGFFEPPEPYENIAPWDAWQRERVRSMAVQPGQELFSDANIKLTLLRDDHSQQHLCTDVLHQYSHGLKIGNYSFDTQDIHSMAIVQSHILLLTVGEQYYELRSDKTCSVRKYLEYWERIKNK